MHGLMQDYKLVVPTIIDHAALNHADQVVVTRGVEDGAIRRITYEAVNRNARLCSSGLQELGMKKGDRIATMAWNTDHHLEAWYGIMGIGAVCHTVNPRLFPEQIIYIINHAEDRVVFTDTTFLPIFEKLIDQLPTVEHFIVLTDKDHLPETSLKNVHSYVEWRDQQKDGFSWVDVDENDACGLCYTSGTTGNPKGVLYSHRSNILHGLIAGTKDTIGFSAADTILPVVPMFHANAWGITFGAPMAGSKMVFPGMQMDGASIHELLETEQCTHAA
ncbi:MAG: AMP-binding protein, partial [Pseudomonadota bacterium]